jgi:hypothetical protein
VRFIFNEVSGYRAVSERVYGFLMLVFLCFLWLMESFIYFFNAYRQYEAIEVIWKNLKVACLFHWCVGLSRFCCVWSELFCWLLGGLLCCCLAWLTVGLIKLCDSFSLTLCVVGF